MKKQVPTESEEQQILFRWAAMQCGKYPELALMFHIPNEGKRSWMTGGRMKAEGLKSGVPDCQKLWLHDLQKQGYCAAVCRGWCEAAECIKNYLEGKA